MVGSRLNKQQIIPTPGAKIFYFIHQLNSSQGCDDKRNDRNEIDKKERRIWEKAERGKGKVKKILIGIIASLFG